MELRKNDYIRTNKKIFKIEDINDYKICVLDTFCELFYSHTTGTTAFFMSDKDEPYTIIKSSPNIIDLIEDKDYVNGKRVIRNCLQDGGNIILFEDGTFAHNDEIKSIVTKEQFKLMEYEV